MLKTFVVFLPGCEVSLDASYYISDHDYDPPSFLFFDDTKTDDDGMAMRVAVFPHRHCCGIVDEEYANGGETKELPEFPDEDDDDKEL